MEVAWIALRVLIDVNHRHRSVRNVNCCASLLHGKQQGDDGEQGGQKPVWQPKVQCVTRRDIWPFQPNIISLALNRAII
jgi:hypothetical protein